MAKGDKQQMAEIVAAAQDLEDELAQLEAISQSVRKIPLNSEKTLARATAELKEVLSLPERFQERLQAMIAALNHMQERQQAALDPLATVTAQIQERTALMHTHMERYASLGQATGEVTALLAESVDN